MFINTFTGRMPPHHPSLGKDYSSPFVVSPPSSSVRTDIPSSLLSFSDSYLPSSSSSLSSDGTVTTPSLTLVTTSVTTDNNIILITDKPYGRQQGILFSKTRSTGSNANTSWRSPSKSTRSSSSTNDYTSPTSSSQHQPSQPNQPRQPNRSITNSNAPEKLEPVLLHIYRARNVRTTLSSRNSAIIVTASVYVPVRSGSSTTTHPTDTVSNGSTTTTDTDHLHQIILPLRGITSQVARIASSPPSTNPPLSVLTQVLQTLQYQGTWQRLPTQSSQTPATDATPKDNDNNSSSSTEQSINGTLLNDLVWDFKIPLLLPSPSSTSSIILLELSDSAQTSAYAGNQGNIGTVILFPEWFPNIFSSSSTHNNNHHRNSTLRSTGILSVPNPGWHTIISNNPSFSSSSLTNTNTTNITPELFLRIDTPSALISTNTPNLSRATVPSTVSSSVSSLTQSSSSSGSSTLSMTPTVPSPAVPSYVTNYTSPVTLVVQPHHHTVYCDRKRAVCTAAGALREGNTLALALVPSSSSSSENSSTSISSSLPNAISAASSTSSTYLGRSVPETVHKDVLCTWYHSDLSNITTESDIIYDLSGTDGRLGDDTMIHPDVFYDKNNQRRFIRISSRSLSDIFTPPPIPGFTIPQDEDPIAAYQRTIQAMSATDAAHHTDSPLYSSPAANRMLRNEATVALLDITQFPLTLIDVGRIITAIITLPGMGTYRILHPSSSSSSKTSLANPTIEPAPPRIREIWIEGEPKVGSTLQARTVYYGGVPGPCEYSWIRVDIDGNRTETEPKPCDPFAPFPLPQTPAALLDPRCYLVTEKDIGCCFKIQCDPVRSDGVRGAPSTSKPTPDIYG